MVSFSQPEAQLDRLSQLHVLYQSGARIFTYSVVNPDGDIVRQEIYDYFNTRPRLHTDDDGNITVLGGVRRVKPEEIPVVKPPSETPRPLPRNPERAGHCISSSCDVTCACICLTIIVARVRALFWVSPRNDFNCTRTAAIGSPLRSRNGSVTATVPLPRPK